MTRAHGAHQLLNDCDEATARAELTRCCGAKGWVEGMLAARPFESRQALLASADDVWSRLGADDYREAFSHHPPIGADVEALRRKLLATSDWSQGEQAGVAGADDALLRELAEGNSTYRERFGFIFIVCATGKSAAEMLELLRARLRNEPDDEVRIAAGEQAKITRLRLEKLGA